MTLSRRSLIAALAALPFAAKLAPVQAAEPEPLTILATPETIEAWDALILKEGWRHTIRQYLDHYSHGWTVNTEDEMRVYLDRPSTFYTNLDIQVANRGDEIMWVESVHDDGSWTLRSYNPKRII